MMNAPVKPGGLRVLQTGYGRAAARIGLVLALGLLLARAAVEAPGAAALSAPVAKGYRVVQPTGPVTNGSTLEFYTFWDSPDYSVEVDLSALDNTTAGPLSATYNGDTVIVVDGVTTDVWSRYWFHTVISAANTRSDAAGITVPVTAVRADPADSTTMYTLNFCLLNHPPVHVGTTFVGPAERFTDHGGTPVYMARNGDSLRIETTWSFATRPFLVSADFSSVDALFDPNGVFYWLSGPNTQPETYSIFYELSEEAHGPSTEFLPVRIDVSDGACGTASATLELLIDNQGPSGAPAFLGELPETLTVQELALAGYAPDSSHDVLVVLNQHRQFVLPVAMLGDSLKFEGTIQLESGQNHLAVYGRDVVGNLSTGVARDSVALVNAPEFRGFKVLLPNSEAIRRGQYSVRNGDPVRIRTYWDSRAAYEVYADFTGVDSNGDPALRATRCADVDTVATVGGAPEVWCCYSVETTISADNTLPDDGGLEIPLTAYDPATGFSTTTNALQFCLLNDRLEHRETVVVGDAERFSECDGILCYRVTNGDRIVLRSTWATHNRPMALLPDFLNLDQWFVINYVTFRLIEESSSDSVVTYEIDYKLRDNAWGSGNQNPKCPVPVTIEGRDAACGIEVATVYFEMDLDGPGTAPVFDPPLPTHVSTGALTIAGVAPQDAVDILVTIEHTDADPESTSHVVLDLDQNQRFSGQVTLLPGSNEVIAAGRDVVHNEGAETARTVKYLTQNAISIPRPFYPGDAFVFDTLAGWSRAQVEVYNLEGDRVRAWTDQSAGSLLQEVSVTWDGQNEDGEPVRQGPYLLRCRMLDGAGRVAMEEVKAFVLQK